MPIGVIINIFAVVIGGFLGSALGKHLSTDFKTKLSMVFGACSMTMGISSIGLMENMPAVIFSVVFGTALGLAIHLGDRINDGGRAMQKLISRFIKAPSNGLSEKEFTDELVTVIVLFCAIGLISADDICMFPRSGGLGHRPAAICHIHDSVSSRRCDLSVDDPGDDQ